MIEIVEYKPSWKEEFIEIGVNLRDHLGDLALCIDHIGSTSVPGLAAKDLIDVQVTVMEWSTAVYDAFMAAGYTKSRHESDHVPPEKPTDPREWEKWLFKSPESMRPVNCHVRMPGRSNQSELVHSHCLLFLKRCCTSEEKYVILMMTFCNQATFQQCLPLALTLATHPSSFP